MKDPFLRRSPPLPAVLKFHINHTHLLHTADAYRMGRINSEMFAKFSDYFNDGMSASQAMLFHQNKLIAEETLTEDMAKSSVNPTLRQVDYMHTKWRFNNFGTIFNPFDKLKENTPLYEEKGSTVKLQETPTWAVMIVTPIMKRIHEFSSSKEVIFLDSTSSCDTMASTVTIMLTASKVGAIPIAVFIHQAQTTESYIVIFNMLKTYFPLAFAGREEGPYIFMTDDSQAEKSALRQVFPASKQLLCHFHVAQAEWRWLRDTKNSIDIEHQKKLMKQFQAVMYSKTEIDFETSVATLERTAAQYESYVLRLRTFLRRKDEWVLWLRSQYVTRNHNTNNFSEATMRIIKDVMLSRTKAFNVAALVSSVISFEVYLQQRLQKFAFNRVRKGALLYESLASKMDHYSAADILQINDNTYSVPSEKVNVPTYEVDISNGICSCPEGGTGAFCKHQCFIHKVLNIDFPNAPIITAEDRHEIGKLAFENTCPSRPFFNDYKEKLEYPIIECEAGVSHVEVTTDKLTDEVAMDTESTNEEKEMLLKEIERLGSFRLKKRTLQNLCGILKKIKNETELDSVVNLFTAVSNRRAGKKIRVQPTAISRRRKATNKGSGRISAGRRPTGMPVKKIKKKRNLAENIAKNQHNAR